MSNYENYGFLRSEVKARVEFDVPTSRGPVHIEGPMDLPRDEVKAVASRIARVFAVVCGPIDEEQFVVGVARKPRDQ